MSYAPRKLVKHKIICNSQILSSVNTVNRGNVPPHHPAGIFLTSSISNWQDGFRELQDLRRKRKVDIPQGQYTKVLFFPINAECFKIALGTHSRKNPAIQPQPLDSFGVKSTFQFWRKTCRPVCTWFKICAQESQAKPAFTYTLAHKKERFRGTCSFSVLEREAIYRPLLLESVEGMHFF